MAQRMTTDQILDTMNRFRQEQEKKMTSSKTPTWDQIDQHFKNPIDSTAAYLLTLRDFDLLREEAKEVSKAQSKDDMIDFCAKAGSAFGNAVVKAVGPLLGGK